MMNISDSILGTTVQKMDKPITLYASGIELPSVKGHPNLAPFEGLLTFLDTPSDKPPSGSRGHNVMIPTAVAAEALPSLIGMGINYAEGFGAHNASSKCGIITKAEIIENRLIVYGFVYARDCPSLMLTTDDLGMSYELNDCYVTNVLQPVWTIEKVTFAGAAVLKRDKAAYKSTTFTIIKGKQ